MSRPREPEAEDFDDQDYPAKRQRQRQREQQRHDQDFWQSEHHLLESADLSINTCSEHTTLAISQHEAPSRAAIDPSQTLVPAAEMVLAEEQARSPSLICYGMIPQIACQRLNVSRDISEESAMASEEGMEYLSLSLAPRRARLVIGTKSAPQLAHMNSKATFVLLEALRSSGVQIRIYVRLCQLKTFLRKEGPSRRADLLFVDANVLGPVSASQATGEVLSKHGVYLQDPHFIDDGVRLHNPQLLGLEVDEAQVWFEELFMDLAADKAKTGDDVAVNMTLNDLSQHFLNADAVAVDAAAVTTPIMAHQGEALDFMCKREFSAAFLESGMCFWVHDRDERGSAIYRHRVTADERNCRPPEPRGGILADEMGLGKTLTTVSLIVSSLERAGLFAGQGAGMAMPVDLPRSRATLVVAPSTQLMDSWKKQLEEHTCEGSLQFSTYYGHSRVQHWSELQDHDIVFTTYGTIATEYRRPRRQVLYHMAFFRIVLDEAHIIRTRRTKLFEAVKALNAAHHWCLTGTPISNKIEDLGTLLDFCRVPLLGDHLSFRQHVAVPVRKAAGRSCSALRETLKPICLRRTKALLNIAEPNAIEMIVTFSGEELHQYRQIMRTGRAAIDDAVSARTADNPRNMMLKILLKLRIFCNQGTYMPTENTRSEQPLDADELRTLLEETEEVSCAVCFSVITEVNQVDDATSGILGYCSHIVCSTCYEHVIIDGAYKCPCCEITVPLDPTLPRTATPANVSKHSSKVDALVENLLQSQDAEVPEKSIVFSAWRKTIAIAADLCAQKGIRAVHIDGKTPHSERSNILDRFADDPSISALLMTIGTGGLGLTITAASRVHILEPQWNPSVEDQAIGRVVRLGQAKATTVIRYVVKDSVEQHVQGYQKRKVNLAKGGFDHRVDTSIPNEHVRLNAEFIAQNGAQRG